MHTHQHPSELGTDTEYPWFRDGSVPPSREDRIAEALALVALLFSLGIGLVIALLPASAMAATAASPSAQVVDQVSPTLVLQASPPCPASPNAWWAPSRHVPATSSNTGTLASGGTGSVVFTVTVQ